MHLLHYLLSCNKLNCVVVLFLAFGCMENVKATLNDAPSMQHMDNGTAGIKLQQKSVKKELKEKVIEEITPLPEKHHIAGDDKTTVEQSTEKLMVKQIAQKTVEKADISETVTEPALPQHQQHLSDKDFALQDDDIMDSLRSGFYFFSLISLGAIVFIVFKICRLRLSRAERKYGVQGDHSTQELTPLPISIEDGHSDDEDQTLFDIQRQNIRIL